MACVCRECGRPVDCDSDVCELCEVEYEYCTCGGVKVVGEPCVKCDLT